MVFIPGNGQIWVEPLPVVLQCNFCILPLCGMHCFIKKDIHFHSVIGKTTECRFEKMYFCSENLSSLNGALGLLLLLSTCVGTLVTNPTNLCKHTDKLNKHWI